MNNTKTTETVDVRNVDVDLIDPDPQNRSYTLDKAFVG